VTPPAVASSTSTHASSLDTKQVEYLWNLTTENIREWLHGANPLFPITKVPKLVQSLSLTDEYGK
jgi:hypothetical protein